MRSMTAQGSLCTMSFSVIGRRCCAHKKGNGKRASNCWKHLDIAGRVVPRRRQRWRTKRLSLMHMGPAPAAGHERPAAHAAAGAEW
jgi:hypothetical protein